MTQQIAGINTLFHMQGGDQPGRVSLVGAGPGDPDLLTVKALRLIEQAKVVVYDRLVSEAVLALLPAQALAIDVGKSPGCHGMKQQDINQLMVDLARGGHDVVRLKGGDPFVFGRGGEEMQALQQAGIDWQVVPGITAAVGCAAATGIPLTHRDMAQSVRLITGHGKQGKPQMDYHSLSDARQTLVFYMGLSWCGELAQQLSQAGRSAQTPVAIVERGTRPEQRTLVTTLAGLADTVSREQVQSPALLIVGEVVNLYMAPATSRAASAAMTRNIDSALIMS